MVSLIFHRHLERYIYDLNWDDVGNVGDTQVSGNSRVSRNDNGTRTDEDRPWAVDNGTESRA